MVNTATVKLWGETIGAVTWLDAGYAAFEFTPAFMEKKWRIAPFTMNAGPGPYTFPALKNASFKGLPGLLADTLPDRFGNALINNWLNKQGRLPESLNPVEALLYTGSRGIGALEFVPAKHIDQPTADIKVNDILDLVNQVLSRDAANAAVMAADEADMSLILLMGSSAGGARAKALVAWNNVTNEFQFGHTPAQAGFTHWILKLDGVENDAMGSPEGFGRVEMAYYEMATACGIEMAESRLHLENGRAHFMTRRFDRPAPDKKLHFQSLHGIRHFDYQESAYGLQNYEQLFQTMRGLKLPYTDAEQMFRRMVFNIAACNVDDHTKNFGFLMDMQGKWSLAPAYDLTFTYNPANLGGSKHALGMNNKLSGFTKDDFREFAQEFNIKKWESIYNNVLNAVNDWPVQAARHKVPPELLTLIDTEIKKQLSSLSYTRPNIIMPRITSADPLSKSADIAAQNIELLKKLFPTIVKEGRIDFEELKAVLGEDLEEGEEYYRFNWAGKSRARAEANKTSTGTLLPNKPEGKDWDNTQNLFIEGDNLEVLKLLQKSYAGKVKMIYIDPPYNTGKDFVYKDDYKDNLGKYLYLTNQTDEAGRKVSTNSETDGRYHSNWLNMMYPRLKLARNLLKEDGVIFISIDDCEISNLRKLCDEIFGEENFIGNIVWKKKTNGNNMGLVPPVHDHIISYGRNTLTIREEEFGFAISQEYLNSKFSNPDNHKDGPWTTMDLSANHKGPYFEIVNPNNSEKHFPSKGRYWVFNQTEVQKRIEEGRIIFGKSGLGKPVQRVFLKDKTLKKFKPETWWDKQGLNSDATSELFNLFGTAKVFDHSKPTSLIKNIVSIYTSGEDIILDFFAGSGTTAHAVMALNAEDQCNRKFISVQIPEPTPIGSEADKAGYKNIAEITKERIRRAGDKVKAETDPLFQSRLDIGFRAYKLGSSNIIPWDTSPDNLMAQISNAENNIKKDRTPDDVLTEILLKSGFELTVPIEQRSVGANTIYSIGFGGLFLCLDRAIAAEVPDAIAAWKEELNPDTCRVIFRDTGLKTDSDKTNAIYTLRRAGIKEVSSI